MSEAYAFDADGFERVRRVVRYVETGGIEHPFGGGSFSAPMEMLIGKADSSITQGNSGTISVWSGTSSTLSDTTLNVTAFARLGSVSSGKWVYLLPTSHGFEIINAEC